MNWQDSAELGRQEAGIGENARTMDTQGLSGVLRHVGTHLHGSVMVNVFGLQIFPWLVASLSLKVLITQGKASDKKMLKTVESLRGPLSIYSVVQCVFTESALWVKSVSQSQCPYVVCLSVCAIVENPLPGGLETSGQRAYC